MVDQHKLAIASGELDKMPPLGMFYHHFYIPDILCKCWINLSFRQSCEKSHHFHGDPDPSFHFYADPDPTLHFNADPDLDPAPHQKDANLRPLV